MSTVLWILNQNSYLPEDGPHLRAFCLGKYLTQKGYDVVVFAGNVFHHSNGVADTGKGLFVERQKEGVRFVYVKTHAYSENDVHRVINIVSYYANVSKIAHEIAERWGRPDIVYGSSLYPTTILLGIKLSRKYGSKFISETRDIVPDGLQAHPLFRKNSVRMACDFLMRRLYEQSNANVFTMSGGKQYVIDKGWDVAHGGRIDLNRIYYINNGVDLELYRADGKRFHIPDNDLDNKEYFCVEYLGSMRGMNNIPLIVDAARELANEGRADIRILLWGTGTKVNEIRRLIDGEGLNNIILKGYVEKCYIPSIAKRADLFILTANFSSSNQYGASPNKLFDYFAAGKPILVPTRLSDSLVQESGAGVELDNPSGKEIATEIMKFADMDRWRYERYCARSLEMAEKFDYRRLAEKLDTVFREA